MWRNKKLILIETLVVVVLVASLGIAAVAHADDETTDQPQDNTTSLMEKVAEIYQTNTGIAIDPEELENAFVQAREEIRTENCYQCLDRLVEQGKITQEEADEFKAWLEARPDFPNDEFREWLDSRPDILGMFGQQNKGGGMMFIGGKHNGVMFFSGNNNGGNGTGKCFRIQSHACCSE